MSSYESEAKDFLKIKDQFQLGKLVTESQNPKTIGLSKLVNENITGAINVLKDIDLEVFRSIRDKMNDVLELQNSINHCLKNNGRIFLVGCGATGRLSLALETLWRIKYENNSELKDKVISFMAGGDVALIHSVEKFEDYPEFGVRQMMELGFNDNDLLIATTEGGETPFVIGATNKAAELSKYNPYFLYCNPDDLLAKTALRSKEVLENKNIKKINLTVGPMAITGSTRMQATTILMYVVGLALLNIEENQEKISRELDSLINLIERTSFDFLGKYIQQEADVYRKNEYIFYETNGDLGITILTDTTERSPTFSLFPFENQLDENKNPSLSYLLFPHSSNTQMAWMDLLKRSPRCFYWAEVTDRTSLERLMGFNFSNELFITRKKYTNAVNHQFKIYFDKNSQKLEFQFNDLKNEIYLGELSLLSVHLFLKIILNSHSTLVMGKLDRYQSNLMTWVRASNFKLIDRSVRYATLLLNEKGINADYDELVIACFKHKDQIGRDQSLVLKLVEEFSS